MVRDAAFALQSGQDFNYLKLSDKLSLSVAFPTAMGLPFVFSLTTPTLLHVRGCVQAHAQPGPLGNSYSSQLPFASINTTADIRFV